MIISSCSYRASALLRCGNTTGLLSSSSRCKKCPPGATNQNRRDYSINSSFSIQNSSVEPRIYNNCISFSRCLSSSSTNNGPKSSVGASNSLSTQSHQGQSNRKLSGAAAASVLTLSTAAYLASTPNDEMTDAASPLEQIQRRTDDFSPTLRTSPLATSSTLAGGSFQERTSNFLHGGAIRVVESPGDWMEKTLSKSSVKSDTKRSSPRNHDISVRALKGSRLSMEDEYFIENDGHFAAVFDGHGGGGVSGYLRDHLYSKLKHKLSTKDDSISKTSRNRQHHNSLGTKIKAIREAFDEIDEDILSEDELQYQGSTAVAVMLHQDENEHRTIISANIGDSRAILSRRGKAIDLTRDHKPNDDQEKARILAMGEKVEWDHYCKVYRVRNLSLSRAVGDRFAKPAVSGDVEIKQFPVNDEGDEFVLLASDGLWDVMTSQECVDFVSRRLKSVPKHISNEERIRALYTKRKVMSRLLANEALRRGTGDNICIVIVWLQDFGEMQGVR
jgi:serine/threonine protein phosphatase PrpC